MGGKKGAETERNRKKQKLTGTAASRSSSWLQPNRLDETQTAPVFIFSLHFVSFCLVYLPLELCSARLLHAFGLPSLTVLHWIGNNVCFFPEPLGHEMHAGCGPKSRSESRERQAGEEGGMKR